MTPEPQVAEEKSQGPVISIQSDWDDFIFSTSQEVWISCKFLGKDSVHSKLLSRGMNLPTSLSKDFSVLSLTQNALEIKYNPTNHTCVFTPPLKTFSKTHKKKILSLDVTDEGLGVSVCAENNLAVWNLISGEIMKTLSGHVGNVYKCKFFPSGIVVLSGGADMQLKIWSATTGDCPVTLIGHKAAVNDFCIIDRGRNIVSVSKDGSAKLWDCGKSNCIATIFESKCVLNCCSLGILPQLVKTIREEPLSEREIGTNNKLLVIGTEEGHVFGIAIFSRKTIFDINIGSPVNLALILVDQLIIGCQNGKIELYKLSDLEKSIRVYKESTSPVLCGCIYKESGFLIGRSDGTVTYYDCITYSNKRVYLTGSDFDSITDISCSSNKIFTSCRDGKIRQYSISDVLHFIV